VVDVKPAAVKTTLRRRVGPRGRELLRRAGRLRWRAKYREARRNGANFRERPWRLLRFVLFDPEFDNFTYEVANETELVQFLETTLGTGQRHLQRYLTETRTDPGLTTDLWRRLRWRLDYKRRPPLGRRATWYVVTRALKPELVVETGVQDGLGALGVLRALARNAEEGMPGRLVSVDTLPTAGWLVPASERHAWQLIIGSSDEVLARTLGAERVGLFLQDSGGDLELARRELELVLPHAADDTIFVSQAQRPALAALCREHDMPYSEFWHQPRDHIFSGTVTGFGAMGPRGLDDRADQLAKHDHPRDHRTTN
jgi:hypothetical protein